MIDFETQIWLRGDLVCGIDEAGRGPMAGPCVVSGVILPKDYENPLIYDSKQLSEKKRDALRQIIERDAVAIWVEIISVEEIDRLNIYRATQQAMEKIAYEAPTSYILTDAMPLKIEGKEVTDIIKGDARSISIAAASIIAKTSRDALMQDYDGLYPQYGFKKHKGYGTKSHKEAIMQYGRCPIHRMSFRFKDELK